MRALVCKRFGPPEDLVLEDVPDPEPGAGHVIVDVHACSVVFPDLLMLEDKYQFKPGLPFTPGTEVAGVVRSVGAGVETVTPGDRVLASVGSGGMAEQVAVAEGSLVAIPGDADFVSAAAFLYAFGTSYYALKDRAQLRPGETMLVLGAAGGVGLAAVELGVAMGATVIAAASTNEKLDLCRARGAAMTINYTTDDLRQRMRELTDGRGADVVYDPVGGDLSEPALRSTAWDGRFLVIGFAAGEIPRVPLNLALLKSASIVGVFWGAWAMRSPDRHRENVAELLTMWRAGSISPAVGAVYPLERGAEALRALADRRALGKIVVAIRDDVVPDGGVT